MASKISWTDETWNPVVGCSKCSPGCQNCYAERMAVRLAHIECKNSKGVYKYAKVVLTETKKWTGEIFCDESVLDKPLHWKKPRRIFVCSMGDLFHPKSPFEFQCQVFNIMHRCPQHIFQVLTKRPEKMLEFFGGKSGAGLNAEPAPNIHLGVSISTPDELWKGEELAKIPAAVKFVSFEPLLADLGDITPYLIAWHIHWVIIGCESINGRAGRFRLKGQDGFFKLKHKVFERAFYQATNLIIRQCKDARVPVFVKQIPLNGKVSKKMAEWPKELRIQEKPDGK